MNVYEVTFVYGNSNNSFRVGARTPEKALDAARKYIRKKYYSDKEITSIEKQTSVDVVAK